MHARADCLQTRSPWQRARHVQLELQALRTCTSHCGGSRRRGAVDCTACGVQPVLLLQAANSKVRWRRAAIRQHDGHGADAAGLPHCSTSSRRDGPAAGLQPLWRCCCGELQPLQPSSATRMAAARDAVRRACHSLLMETNNTRYQLHAMYSASSAWQLQRKWQQAFTCALTWATTCRMLEWDTMSRR